ncbi:hypothetical protein IAD21_02506 [Abditibacteriota bacterium]|nr:hypothetical protein IAD21_02506 [Abditibacteriota bacterium]
MTNSSGGQGSGSGCLCCFLGFVWAATVMPFWGFLSLLWSDNSWMVWNIACFVHALTGVFVAIKIASLSPHEAVERDVSNNWKEVFLSAISFALAFIFVWLGLRALVTNFALS